MAITKDSFHNLKENFDFDLWFASLNPAPVIRFNVEGQIEMANPAAIELFAPKDLARNNIKDLLPELARINLEAWLKSETIYSFESTIANKHLALTLRTVPDIKSIYLYGSDVTNLKITEDKLISSQGFLRKVIDTNPNLIFVKNREGRFLLANEAVAKIYGTTVEGLIGKTDADFNDSDEEVENFSKDDSYVIDTGTDLFIPEEQVTTASGDLIWLETVKKPISLYDGRRLVLGVATDISTRKNLQGQLLHSQKLEAVGQLAGGIAHDFNNLLTGMLGYSNLLIEQPSLSDDAQHAVAMIRNAAEQATELTQKLLGFARKGKHHNVAVNIHEIIEDTLALLNRTLEKNILIQRSLIATNPVICGDPTQMQQIILNLAINARDSMASGANKHNGKLTLSTKVVSAEEIKTEVPLSNNNQYYLNIAVSDTGCGIMPEDLNKIFDPFFTTKGDKHGTGLGLSMVYGIVRNHNGYITVHSTINQGSRFDVYLPCYQEKIAITHKLRESKYINYIKGKGKILLVDDHQVIRAVTSDMLKSLGYEVITAQNGLEAIEYFENNSSAIDLIILDMIMPGLSAKECFDRLKNINPRVRVVLSTGYVANNQVQEILGSGMVGFMQKPYMLNQLSKIVADALEGKMHNDLLIH